MLGKIVGNPRNLEVAPDRPVALETEKGDTGCMWTVCITSHFLRSDMTKQIRIGYFEEHGNPAVMSRGVLDIASFHSMGPCHMSPCQS
jgi:hypothetical protein